MKSGGFDVAETLGQAFAMLIATGRLGTLLTADALLRYADEDPYGGRDTGDFPDGVSIYRNEGRLLHALTRALRPATALEFGCAVGGSATHLLSGLHRNGYGALVSVDRDAASGALIPAKLRKRWSLATGDALSTQLPAQADLVFEDTDHTYATTVLLLQRALRLRPKCVISHDYMLTDDIRQAWNRVFGEGNFVITLLSQEFMPTGMAIWLADGAVE